MLLQDSQKPFSIYKFLSKNVFGWCQKKAFALHRFLDAQELPFSKHFESKCQYMSVISAENICSRDVRSFYLVRGWGWEAEQFP